MKININDFGKDFFAFMQQSHEGMSEESIKNGLKEIFTKHGIDDSNFALISVAIGESSIFTEEKSTTSYINKFSKKLFEKAEKQKERREYIERFGKEPESQEDIEKTKDEKFKKKYVTHFDKNKIKLLKEEELEDYALSCLKESGIPDEFLDDKIANYKQLNNFIDVNFTSESTLRDLAIATAKYIKRSMDLSKKSSDTPITDSQDKTKTEGATSSEVEDKTTKVTPDQYHIVLDEIKEKLKSALENTSNINVGGGFDIDKVAPLFVGRDNLLTAFENFLVKYNEIMNKFYNNQLDENQILDYQNDINPFFQELLATANQYGEAGVQVANLGRGLKHRIDHIAQKESNGEEQNILKDQAKFNNSGTERIDSNDIDGQTVNCEEHESTINNDIETSEQQSDIPEDIQQKIDEWGVDGIRTLADWIDFKESDEYKMIQAMVLEKEKTDNN